MQFIIIVFYGIGFYCYSLPFFDSTAMIIIAAVDGAADVITVMILHSWAFDF